MEKTDTIAPMLEERIFQMVAEEAHRPPEMFDRDSALAEYLDSLGRVELVMKLEDEFEFLIPDDEADKIVTIGQLIDAVRQKLDAIETAGGPDADGGHDAPPSP